MQKMPIKIYYIENIICGDPKNAKFAKQKLHICLLAKINLSNHLMDKLRLSKSLFFFLL